MQKFPWDVLLSLSVFCERLRSVMSLTRDLKLRFPRTFCRQNSKHFFEDPARMWLVKQSTLISPVLHPVHTDNANLYAKDWQTLLSELLWEKRISEFALLFVFIVFYCHRTFWALQFFLLCAIVKVKRRSIKTLTSLTQVFFAVLVGGLFYYYSQRYVCYLGLFISNGCTCFPWD